MAGAALTVGVDMGSLVGLDVSAAVIGDAKDGSL